MLAWPKVTFLANTGGTEHHGQAWGQGTTFAASATLLSATRLQETIQAERPRMKTTHRVPGSQAQDKWAQISQPAQGPGWDLALLPVL